MGGKVSNIHLCSSITGDRQQVWYPDSQKGRSQKWFFSDLTRLLGCDTLHIYKTCLFQWNVLKYLNVDICVHMRAYSQRGEVEYRQTDENWDW